MIAAAHLENLLFLLLVAVAALFQFLVRAAAKTNKSQTKPTSTAVPRTPPPISRAPSDSDEEQIRKLLEALGKPPTSKPPPTVVPRTDVPPRPLAPIQPPAARAWELTREARRKRETTPKGGPAKPAITRAEKIAPPNVSGSPTFEVYKGPLPITSTPISKSPAKAYAEKVQTIARVEQPQVSTARLLASTSDLRDAIILREILGPPRGLRGMDLL